MDVDVMLRKIFPVDPVLLTDGTDIADPCLRRLLHHIAELSGQLERAFARHHVHFDLQRISADTRPGQSAHDPDLIHLILPVIGIPLPAEVTGKILFRDLHGFFLTLIDLPCGFSADLPELAL